MNPMKALLALAGLLCIVPFATAKTYDWKDSTVINISSRESGAAAMPIGTTIIAVPIRLTYYWIKTNDGMIYVAVSRNLNVTVNGHNGFRFDDHGYIHILDDAGKDRKLRMVEKIAPRP